VDAFFDGVFFFDFQPFFKKVIVNFSFYGDGFVAFFRRSVSLSSYLVFSGRTLFKVSRIISVSPFCFTANYIFNHTKYSI